MITGPSACCVSTQREFILRFFFSTALILFNFAQRDCASPMIPIFFKTFPVWLTTKNLAQAQYYKNPVFYIELIENEFAAAIQNFNHCGSKKFESSTKRIPSRGYS